MRTIDPLAVDRINPPAYNSFNQLFPEDVIGAPYVKIRKILIEQLNEPIVARLVVMNDAEILAIPGIGPSSLERIKRKLNGAGLFNRPDKVSAITQLRTLASDNPGLVPATLYDVVWEKNAAIDYIIQALQEQYGFELTLQDLFSYTEDDLVAEVIEYTFNSYDDFSFDSIKVGARNIGLLKHDWPQPAFKDTSDESLAA